MDWIQPTVTVTVVDPASVLLTFDVAVTVIEPKLTAVTSPVADTVAAVVPPEIVGAIVQVTEGRPVMPSLKTPVADIWTVLPVVPV